jgi:hypothetical protein
MSKYLLHKYTHIFMYLYQLFLSLVLMHITLLYYLGEDDAKQP